MATANEVIKIARQQIGIKESPAGSNRQKFGKTFGMNGVAWCAEFVWWCAWKADNKQTKTIAKSASAAYIQDETVNKYGGSWVMKKNKSTSTRSAYCHKAKPGDIVSFDFGAMDAIRDHVGMVDHVEGTYIYCLEGNTTPDGKSGSQSNGGMVALKKRHYKAICSAVRPRYKGGNSKLDPLDVDGDMGFQTITRLQRWLGVSQDGDCGKQTVKALQKKIGLTGKSVDGDWGKETTKTLQRYLNINNGAGLVTNGKKDKATIRALQRYLNKVVTK